MAWKRYAAEEGLCWLRRVAKLEQSPAIWTPTYRWGEALNVQQKNTELPCILADCKN